MFARTQLNYADYFADYGIDLTYGSWDCDAIRAGASASFATLGNLLSTLSGFFEAWTNLGTIDRDALASCWPTRHGSLEEDQFRIAMDLDGDLTFSKLDQYGSELFSVVADVDGSFKHTAYDLSDDENWSEQTTHADAGGLTESVDTLNDDGSRHVAGFNDEGNPTWTYDEGAGGSGALTDASGTTYDFTSDVNVDFAHAGGTPELTIELGQNGPAVHVSVNDDGTSSVDVNGGAEIVLPGGSDVSFNDQGAWTTAGTGDAGAEPGGGTDAPFEPGHPSPLQNRDPIILDLDGDGVALTSVDQSTAYFDYGGSGFSVRTGWAAPSEGMLIRDLDQNAAVSANELFGAVSGNGFTDLAAFDANADGKIDANDAVFAELRVWRDLDSDGAGDAGELSTLADAGVAAINLAPAASGQTVNGNLVVETSSFVRTNGTTGAVAEVLFATDAIDSQYTPPPGFVFSQTAFLLPNLIGYGVVPNLIYAMSEDPTLEQAVRDLVLGARTMSGQEFDAAFEALVQQWTGSDMVARSVLHRVADAYGAQLKVM